LHLITQYNVINLSELCDFGHRQVAGMGAIRLVLVLKHDPLKTVETWMDINPAFPLLEQVLWNQANL